MGKSTKSRALQVTAPKTPEAMMALALRSKASVEIVERVSALAAKWKADMARDAFFRDLAEFQHECPPIEKTRTVRNKPEKGGGIRYRFAPYEVIKAQVEPFMYKWGFSHTVKTHQTKTMVKAIVQLMHRGGHSEVTEFAVPVDQDTYMTAPQKVGAALTFATRYAFVGALGLTLKGVDTDANEDDIPPARKPKPATAEKPLQAPRQVGTEHLYEQVINMVETTPFSPQLKEMWKTKAAELKAANNLSALGSLAESILGQKKKMRKEA